MSKDSCQAQSSSPPSLFASKKVQQARKDLWNSLLSVYEHEASVIQSDDGIFVTDLEITAADLTDACLASSQLISEPKLRKHVNVSKTKNVKNNFIFQKSKVKMMKCKNRVRKTEEQKSKSFSKQTKCKKTNESGKENNSKILSKVRNRKTIHNIRNTTHTNVKSYFAGAKSNKRVFVYEAVNLIANICSCGFINRDFIF